MYLYKICSIFIILFNISLFSYDKIEVIAYLEDPSLSSLKYVYVKDDKVYVLLSNNLKIYSSSLTYITSINLKSENPISLSVNDDKIYILDSKKCNIDVYDLDGNKFFSFGSCGENAGQLISPQDLKITENRVFVADNSGFINIYSLDGVFLYSFITISKDGTKKYFPSRIFFDPERFIYIIDKKNQMIGKYDINGKCHFEYNKKDFPADMTENGFIYTGSEDGKIREYDIYYNQKGVFGTKGRNKYEFQSFSDIRAYKDGIYVADSKNQKIIYLKIQNKNIQKFKKQTLYKDYIWIKPYKSFKIESSVFNIFSDIIYFYNDKKGAEGIYIYDKDSSITKLISYGKDRNISGVSDIIEHNGRVYILDNIEKKVKVYEKGNYIFSFGDKMGFLGGSKEGRFSEPIKMTFDLSEKIYILDIKLYMIQVFNNDGVFLYSIDLSAYKNINFRDILSDDENNIYLLSDKKIFIFSSDGKYIKEFELKNIELATSFCYDNVNYIYVLDKKKSRVMIYDKKGTYISSFLGKGFGNSELKYPLLIRYNKSKIYILDSNERITSFSVDYNVYSSLFNVVYDSATFSVNFNFEIDNKEYLKKLVIEKSTNSKFSEISSTETDYDLVPGNTYYYRLKLVSITDNISFSDIKSVFIFKDITKKGEQSLQVNKPPFEIIPVNLDYIFASSYKYYLSNPVGKINIKNNTTNNFENLKLSFFIKEYMDFPYDIVIDSLPAGSQKEVNVNATLNSKIITITEITPIQARLTLEYYLDGERKEISLNIPVRILSRNSIVWDDMRRIASFITIKDPVILDLSKVISSKKDEIEANVDDNLKVFSLIYNYLSLLGIKYVEDPVTPYKVSRTSYTIIDMVQYPRNILRIKAGDCDDLTVTFSSFLEASGIETIIFDYGDHITVGFELKNKNIADSGIPPDAIVDYDGNSYIPFEVTMVGKDIYSSIKYAVSNYKNKKADVKIYKVRDMLSIYEPPTFNDNFSQEISIDKNVISKSQSDVDMIEKSYFDYYEKYYKSILAEDPKNFDVLIKLATIYGFQGKYQETKKILEEVLKDHPDDAAALNNLGNIYYIEGQYEKAKEYYEKAYKKDPYDSNILINLSKTFIKMGKKEDAKIMLENAFRMEPELKKFEKEILREE